MELEREKLEELVDKLNRQEIGKKDIKWLKSKNWKNNSKRGMYMGNRDNRNVGEGISKEIGGGIRKEEKEREVRDEVRREEVGDEVREKAREEIREEVKGEGKEEEKGKREEMEKGEEGVKEFKDFSDAVNFIEEFKGKGKRVYVHEYLSFLKAVKVCEESGYTLMEEEKRRIREGLEVYWRGFDSEILKEFVRFIDRVRSEGRAWEEVYESLRNSEEGARYDLELIGLCKYDRDFYGRLLEDIRLGYELIEDPLGEMFLRNIKETSLSGIRKLYEFVKGERVGVEEYRRERDLIEVGVRDVERLREELWDEVERLKARLSEEENLRKEVEALRREFESMKGVEGRGEGYEELRREVETLKQEFGMVLGELGRINRIESELEEMRNERRDRKSWDEDEDEDEGRYEEDLLEVEEILDRKVRERLEELSERLRNELMAISEERKREIVSELEAILKEELEKYKLKKEIEEIKEEEEEERREEELFGDEREGEEKGKVKDKRFYYALAVAVGLLFILVLMLILM